MPLPLLVGWLWAIRFQVSTRKAAMKPPNLIADSFTRDVVHGRVRPGLGHDDGDI